MRPLFHVSWLIGVILFAGCSRMPPEMTSAKVGKFAPDLDPSDGMPLGLVVNYAFPGEGEVRLALPSVTERRSKAEWAAVVARFDKDFDRLIPRVAAVRSEVAPKVLELHRNWFPKKAWTGSAEDLMRHLKLKDVNYYGDGSFAVWFECDDLFDRLDLNVELNQEWVVDIVKFDG